jgi:DinB superfamily
MKSTDVRKQTLLDHLDSIFFGPAWHGASLMRTIRAVDLAHATMENQEGFSPWKIVLHCAYWKYAVRRRISPAVPKLSFPRRPSNFPRLPPELSEEAWLRDRQFLEEQHALLREAVIRLPASRLDAKPAGSRFTLEQTILGAAAHDAYHTAHIRNLGVMEF